MKQIGAFDVFITVFVKLPAEGSGKSYKGECIFYTFSEFNPGNKVELHGSDIVRIEGKGSKHSQNK